MMTMTAILNNDLHHFEKSGEKGFTTRYSAIYCYQGLMANDGDNDSEQ